MDGGKSLVSRKVHRLLRVPPTGSSAVTFTHNTTSCCFRLTGLRPPVLTRPAVFTKNIASCDFFLADLRRLVLTRPSGPGDVVPCALMHP